MNDSFLSWHEVKALLKISRSTAFRWARRPDSDFPQHRIVGPNSVRWLKSEIDHFIATRMPAAEQSRRSK